MDQCDTPWIIQDDSMVGASANAGAWLAQCSLPNVSFGFDDPKPVLNPEVFDEEEREMWTGEVGDVCLWMRETQGKSGTAKLSFFRDVAQAWRVDCQGREFDSLSVVDGQVTFFVKPLEQSRILVRWKGVAPASTMEPNAT
jgi:hypothetical protein